MSRLEKHTLAWVIHSTSVCAAMVRQAEWYLAHGLIDGPKVSALNEELGTRRAVLAGLTAHGEAWEPDTVELAVWRHYILKHATLQQAGMSQAAFLAEAARLRQERDRRLVGMRRLK
ncbi:hypothetical protein HC928_01380 [bacterium]|nr:hypothetical protein [bacterium]